MQPTPTSALVLFRLSANLRSVARPHAHSQAKQDSAAHHARRPHLRHRHRRSALHCLLPLDQLSDRACLSSVFGASGDLGTRAILPALFELLVAGRLPDRALQSFSRYLYTLTRKDAPACHVVAFTRSSEPAETLRQKTLDQFIDSSHLHDGQGVSDPSRVPEFADLFSYIAEADKDETAYDRLEAEVSSQSQSISSQMERRV